MTDLAVLKHFGCMNERLREIFVTKKCADVLPEDATDDQKKAHFNLDFPLREARGNVSWKTDWRAWKILELYQKCFCMTSRRTVVTRMQGWR